MSCELAPRVSTVRTLLLALLFVTGGCDLPSLLYGDTTTSPPVFAPIATGDAANWTLDVGTGEGAFEPLVDGQAVAKIEGSQGGYHVWVSLHLDGAIPETVDVQIEVSAGGAVISRAAEFTEPQADPPPPTRKVILAKRAFVEATTVGEIVIDVKVVDPATNAWVSGQKRVVLR
jgi:hypothetical protein